MKNELFNEEWRAINLNTASFLIIDMFILEKYKKRDKEKYKFGLYSHEYVIFNRWPPQEFRLKVSSKSRD